MRWAPSPAGSCATAATASSCPSAIRPRWPAALRALAGDNALRERLGAAARHDVAAYTEDAWVEGMRQALAAVGAGR